MRRRIVAMLYALADRLDPPTPATCRHSEQEAIQYGLQLVGWRCARCGAKRRAGESFPSTPAA